MFDCLDFISGFYCFHMNFLWIRYSTRLKCIGNWNLLQLSPTILQTQTHDKHWHSALTMTFCIVVIGSLIWFLCFVFLIRCNIISTFVFIRWFLLAKWINNYFFLLKNSYYHFVVAHLNSIKRMIYYHFSPVHL